jgi:uncharacterized protein YcfL
MKKLILLIILLMLNSCTTRVDNWLIDKSINLCNDHKGINYLDTSNIVISKVRCNDGIIFKLDTASDITR